MSNHHHHLREPDPGARDPLPQRGPGHGTVGCDCQSALAGQDQRECHEATSFFDVVCWRDLAENVALSLSKGMRVVVTGRIEQRSWETDEGEHRSKVEIVAEEVGPSLRFATADVQRSPAPPGDGGILRVNRHRSHLVLRPASRAGSPGPPGGPTRGTRHRSDRRATP